VVRGGGGSGESRCLTLRQLVSAGGTKAGEKSPPDVLRPKACISRQKRKVSGNLVVGWKIFLRELYICPAKLST
jgi:hypothetical protein